MCTDDKHLQDEVMNLMPMVQSVNAMAEEMDKPVEFSMLLVSPEARGLDTGRTEVHRLANIESSPVLDSSRINSAY